MPSAPLTGTDRSIIIKEKKKEKKRKKNVDLVSEKLNSVRSDTH